MKFLSSLLAGLLGLALACGPALAGLHGHGVGAGGGGLTPVVSEIGHVVQAANVSASVPLTTTSAVATGDEVWCAVFNDSSHVAITGASDSANGAYSLGANIDDDVGFWTVQTFYVVATAPLASGSTITFTLANSPGIKYVQCMKATNMKSPTASVHDSGTSLTAIHQTASTSPAVTTSALAQASEVVFVVVPSDAGSGTVTLDSSGSGFTDVTPYTNAAFNDSMHVAYKIVTGSAGLTVPYSGTLSVSGQWFAIYDTYKVGP